MVRSVRHVRPTRSYEIEVPVDVSEEVDGNVVSYWIPGKSTLLQLSSTARVTGDQIGASQRLAERLAGEQLTDIKQGILAVEGCSDFAAACGHDAEGVEWHYNYAVWSDLAVFMTVSADSAEGIERWAFEAIRSIRRGNWPS